MGVRSTRGLSYSYFPRKSFILSNAGVADAFASPDHWGKKDSTLPPIDLLTHGFMGCPRIMSTDLDD
jgi:hypothetical protein